MVKAILEQYRVADFLEWNQRKQLVLNPHFQRGSVWSLPAKVFLIDTVLRGLPIPKVYLRTQIDNRTKTSFREVVDGQQRLKAIIDFANDEIRLTKRAGEFEGLRYSTLDNELKDVFLTYPIGVDQLINASDDDVLEVFARLNSYTVTLNDPEKRHARFQGGFKWSVRNVSRRWSHLLESLGAFTIRERVRMLDDSLIAEMFGVAIEGVTDGGQGRITKLYERQDPGFPEDDPAVALVEGVFQFIQTHFIDAIVNSPWAGPNHLLMLFAAVAHALYGIPQGQVDKENEFPARDPGALSDLNLARQNLATLGAVIAAKAPPPGFKDFWSASERSTQRIASRRVRFPVIYRALLPEPLPEG